MLLSLTVAGCSTLGIAKDLFMPSKGMEIDTELVVGDKEESNEARIGDNQQAELIQNIQEIPWWILVMACLGWFLPGPGAMWKGFLQLIPWSRR